MSHEPRLARNGPVSWIDHAGAAGMMLFCSSSELWLDDELTADFAAGIHCAMHVDIGIAAQDRLHHVVGGSDRLIGNDNEFAQRRRR